MYATISRDATARARSARPGGRGGGGGAVVGASASAGAGAGAGMDEGAGKAAESAAIGGSEGVWLGAAVSDGGPPAGRLTAARRTTTGHPPPQRPRPHGARGRASHGLGRTGRLWSWLHGAMGLQRLGQRGMQGLHRGRASGDRRGG